MRKVPSISGYDKKVVPGRKSSPSYQRIKYKQVTVLLSNQNVRKRYTLIL
jgi:hypothetical protein